jgi:hypothetical protein
MYVVCLDCGKRFHYNWERMRIGEPTEKPVAVTAGEPDLKRPLQRKSRLRYFAAACALPILWLAGKAAVQRLRSRTEKEQKSEHEN